MIKILFIDSSALLSFFVSGKGSTSMRHLLSSESNARYIINNQVINEFENNIKAMINSNEIRQSTADSILTLFNTHYKNRLLKIVGKNASVEDTIEGMYNFLGRISRPILVTCNQQQASAMQSLGYQTINPEIHTSDNINELLIDQQTSLSVH